MAVARYFLTFLVAELWPFPDNFVLFLVAELWPCFSNCTKSATTKGTTKDAIRRYIVFLTETLDFGKM